MTSNPTSTFASQVLSSIGKKLYLKEDRADVHFIFNTTDIGRVKVPAHKFLLIEASDIFSKMFNGSWKENNEVEIDDASAGGFKEFLQIIYLDEVNLTIENVAQVMYLGTKYNVDECLTISSKFLRNIINETNICWGYKLGITYEQENLKKFCEAIVFVKTKEILASDGFLRCDFDLLNQILRLESLSCSERELFEACMKRIEILGQGNELAKATAETETKQLVKSFHFGSMTFKEWTKLSLAYCDFFSPEEYREIIHLIGSKNFQSTKLNSNRQKRFNIVPFNGNNIIRCNRKAATYFSVKEFYVKDVEVTTFSTNQTALLSEFVCTKIWYGDDRCWLKKKLATEFTVFETSGGVNSTNSNERVALYSGKAMLQSKPTVITLKKKILIKAASMYEIHLKFEQSAYENHTLWNNLKPKVIVEPDFTVQFYNDIPDIEIISRGLIKELVFIQI